MLIVFINLKKRVFTGEQRQVATVLQTQGLIETLGV